MGGFVWHDTDDFVWHNTEDFIWHDFAAVIGYLCALMRYCWPSMEFSSELPQCYFGAKLNSTLGKAMIDVNWSTVEADAELGYKWKLIPVTF